MPGLDVFEEANSQLIICNACRYCEGYCPVFRAIETRRDFQRGDVFYLSNLCHDCRACYYACMYTPAARIRHQHSENSCRGAHRDLRAIELAGIPGARVQTSQRDSFSGCGGDCARRDSLPGDDSFRHFVRGAHRARRILRSGALCRDGSRRAHLVFLRHRGVAARRHAVLVRNRQRAAAAGRV